MKEKIKITHEGNLPLGDFEIPCYVLENGTRVISGRGMQDVLKLAPDSDKSKKRRAGDNLARFVSNKWFNDLITKPEEVAIFKPIECYKGQQKINGYEATALVDFCNVILQARKDGKINTERRELIAEQCEILIRSFAKVGIIALIDEVTGYQEVRDKEDLRSFLKKFLMEEKTKYIDAYPDEFFEMIFKMRGLTWSKANKGKNPQYFGHYINNYVYARLGPEVLYSLRKLNPKDDKGKRATKHYNHTTPDYGFPKLKEHLNILVVLGKAAGYNWNNWIRLVERAFPKFSQDGSRIQELPFTEVEVLEEKNKKGQ